MTEPKTTIRQKLRSALNSALPTPTPPPAPRPRAVEWQNPDPADIPSEREQRREGVRALANIQRPKPPQYGAQHLGGGGR